MIKDGLVTWLEGIIEYSLYALIFTLPFSKSMVELFFGLALACWAIKRLLNYIGQPLTWQDNLKDRAAAFIKAFAPARSELNRPLYALLFVAFLSMLTSVSLPLSLEGFFFKIIEWVMIYFMVVETMNTKEKLNRMIIVLIFSTALIGIDGMFQLITGKDFIFHRPLHDHRVRASFDGPNGFAAWLVAMIPLILSLAYFSKIGWLRLPFNNRWSEMVIRAALWALTGILLICLIATSTRGAWLAALLAVLFLGMLSSKKLFIATIIILLILPLAVQGPIKKRAVSILSQQDQGTKNQRIKLWQEAISIIKDFPFLGSGPNTYTAVIPAHTKTTYTGYYPHNSYLHMAAEIGLLGLGAFLWMIAALFKTALSDFRKSGEGLYHVVLMGLLAGLFGFLLHSFIDVHFYSLQLGNLMWFFIGLIIATQKIALGEKVKR